MKNTLLLTVSAFAALGFISNAQQTDETSIMEEKAKPASIYGAYELKLGDGSIRKRFITNGRWAITQSHPTTGDLIFHHGGSYIFDGKNYIEKVEYAAPSTRNLIGNNHKFIITVKEGSIHMKGVDNPWDEIWVRVDDKSQQDAVDLSVPTVPPKE